MFYAYLLQSIPRPDRLYHGHSSDLKQRLLEHNSGRCLHTAKFMPWKLRFYAAFDSLARARWPHQFDGTVLTLPPRTRPGSTRACATRASLTSR
jgi:hypothetical protein